MKRYGALEAGGTKMVCAVGDETGNVLQRVSIPTRTPAGTIPEMIGWFRDKGISALGIGCFGPIDLDKASPTYGYITSTPKLAWRGCDIVGAFREGLGVPVGFDTDVNASALGEATWGAAKDVANSIYITVGTGIGVGVIVDGKPYHGLMHPEGGHIFLVRHPDDPMERGVCPCHASCMEGYASGPAIEARWGKPGRELAAREAVWALEAYYIGQAICDYICLLSPERIILGGGVLHQESLLPMIRKEVEKQMGGYIQNKAMADLERYIVPMSLNDNQGVMGCIKLAIRAEKEEEK